jgi:hypothetical protein
LKGIYFKEFDNPLEGPTPRIFGLGDLQALASEDRSLDSKISLISFDLGFRFSAMACPHYRFTLALIPSDGHAQTDWIETRSFSQFSEFCPQELNQWLVRIEILSDTITTEPAVLLVEIRMKKRGIYGAVALIAVCGRWRQ